MTAVSEQERLDQVSRQIFVLRGQKVLLDTDLAVLYGVQTKRLLEQVKRNRKRFPSDFVFRVSDQELINLRSQIATSSLESRGWGGKRYDPYVFTEHGALMAANVLHSKRAIEVCVFVVRAFIRLRNTLSAHKDLVKKLDELEKKTESLANKHDALASTTRDQFRQVIETLRQLMAPQETRRKPIGFVRQD